MELTLTPPQHEIMQAGLLDSGFHCLLQMPTGSGKTWLAEQAIGDTLATGKRAIYVTPLRALADELTEHWKTRFAPHPVGVFTGDYGRTGRAFPVPFSHAALLVMTPERLDACIREWRAHWHWLPKVDLVVVDEFHLLGEAQRGARLEGTLLRMRRLNPFARIIALSATIGNRVELAQWLEAVEYASDWRPVPLTWRIVRYKRALDKPEILASIVGQTVSSGGKSLVFVQSRRRAEELATYLSHHGLRTLHHHAGLGHDQRRKVESAFRGHELDVLVATATLEMGINLPARQVVLYDLQQFDGAGFSPLSTNTVWQRAGRAGRRGLDTEGEVVLLAPAWDRAATHYEKGSFEPILSQLNEPAALAEQIVTEIASGMARSPGQLERAFAQTLAARQRRLPHIVRAVKEMEEAGLLVWKENASSEHQRLLAATPLARVAVRHFLAPATVLLFRRALAASDALTFFDLLLIAASAIDCEPVLAVDFEELDALAAEVQREVTNLLLLSGSELTTLLGIGGRRLLAAVKMALVMRGWTRLGDADAVAERFDCYTFEVLRLQESAVRLLAAMRELAALDEEKPKHTDTAGVSDDEACTGELIAALSQMVSAGLDESAATLTFVAGIGPRLARRLAEAGIEDIEALAQSEVDALAAVRGISRARAGDWVTAANAMLPQRSALRYRETGARIHLPGSVWPADVDLYRLRRALDLRVQTADAGRSLVTGGLEPHLVAADNDGHHCDCADARRGHQCKHVLAVRLSQEDLVLTKLVERIADSSPGTLDLFALWMERTG